MEYLNSLWLRCYREARAADPPLSPPFREVKPGLQTCWQWPAACKPKHPPLLCLGVAMRRKQSHKLSRAGEGSSHSLPAFPSWLQLTAMWVQGYSYSWKLLTSTFQSLLLKKTKQNKTTYIHFPSWLKTSHSWFKPKGEYLFCFAFHIFLSLNNMNVTV